MKRLVLFISIFVFALAGSAGAQGLFDMTGQMLATGYFGYSLGFGDAFQDIEVPGMKVSFGPTFNFGGQFFYGWKGNLMVGGEMMLQSYKLKAEYTEVDWATGLETTYEASDSETKFNIVAEVLYGLNYTDESGFFLNGGLGIYDSDVGMCGGFMFRKLVSEKIYIYGMPRLHVIFADSTPMILQLAAGLQFPIG